jgi:methylmalonyl-CoA/ethylmalonyl-CoA epimerase
MKIDHICFSVNNINDAIEYWESVFEYKQMTAIIENSLQKVKVAFLSKENSITIKLIEPSGNNNSLKSFNIRGGGFHHVCFKCDDLSQKINELREKGLKLLVPPQPGEAFNNNNIAFLLAKNGLSIELIDSDEKAGLISSSLTFGFDDKNNSLE